MSVGFSKTTAQPQDGLRILELKIIKALKAKGATFGTIQIMKEGVKTKPTNQNAPAISYPSPDAVVTLRNWAVWDTGYKKWL